MQAIQQIIANSPHLSASNERKQKPESKTEEPQQPITSSSDYQFPPRFAAMMEALWQSLTMNWGEAFVRVYGEKWEQSIVWQEAIKGLTRNQVVEGLNACKRMPEYREFAPKPHAFHQIALEQPIVAGMPSYESLREQAIKYHRYMDLWELQPAVLWMIFRAGVSAEDFAKMADKDDRRFRNLYEKLMQHIANGGELPIVEKPVALIVQKPTPEQRKQSLSVIGEMLQLYGGRRSA